VPPLLGDIEALFGYSAALVALVVCNTASLATLVGAMLAPNSNAWALGLAGSSLFEVLARTAIQQRILLQIAGGLHARFGVRWPMHLVEAPALRLVYLQALGGAGYVAPTMAMCIGCLRAVTFAEPRSIVWLDVSPTVPWVLLAQFCFGFCTDTAVWLAKRRGFIRFVLAARPLDHPFGLLARRDFDFKGYALVFGLGAFFIYAMFLVFLGPGFVTGTCREFVANAASESLWVIDHHSVSGCANDTNGRRAAAAAPVTNSTRTSVR
jgi:hypothetical protein